MELFAPAVGYAFEQTNNTMSNEQKENKIVMALLAAILGTSNLKLVEDPKDVLRKVSDLMKELQDAADIIDTDGIEYPLEMMYAAIMHKRTKIRELANYYRSLQPRYKELQEISHRHEADILKSRIEIANESGFGEYCLLRGKSELMEKMIEADLKITIIGTSVRHHQIARLDFIAMNCMLAIIDLDEMLNGKIVTGFTFSDN